MKAVAKLSSSLFILFLASVTLSGCSVIGYLIGSGVDGRHGQFDQSNVKELSRMLPGTRIMVTMQDGTAYVCEFQEISFRVPAEYRRRYQAWRTSDSLTQVFPAIDDTVSLTQGIASSKVLAGKFKSFTPDAIWLLADTLRSIPLDSIRWVADHKSRKIQGELLRKVILSGTMPTNSARIVLDCDAGEVSPRVDSVLVVEKWSESGTGTFWGLAIGLTLDMLCVIQMRGL